MVNWIEPVTNRSQADVDNKTDKGFYNIEDLNRVGQDSEYLAELLNQYGYAVTIAPKTNWVMEDFPTEETMATYLDNIRALIEAYYALPDTPDLPPDMELLTYSLANAIEENLQDVRTVLDRMISGFRRSKTFKAGQGCVILP